MLHSFCIFLNGAPGYPLDTFDAVDFDLLRSCDTLLFVSQMSTPDIRQIDHTLQFECDVCRFEYTSPTLGNTVTRFYVLAPRIVSTSLPVLYYLSGLTCTDQNFVEKTCATKYLQSAKLVVVCCDTSPRGACAPHEEESWDFGTGAGFYLNATKPEYAAYRMYDFVKDELPRMVKRVMGDRVDTRKAGIFGHSMGGHGALVLALRNTDKYTSVSAFAPIANPVDCPWGTKCFGLYLGDDHGEWEKYDATMLMKRRTGSAFDDSILIDQGSDDGFLEKQLKPHAFVDACERVGQKVSVQCT